MLQEIFPNTEALVCMMTTPKITQTQEPVLDTTHPAIVYSISLTHTITQTPFLYTPPGFLSHQAMETLTLPNMSLAISVWYLLPITMSADLGHILGGSMPVPPSQETIHIQSYPTLTTTRANKKAKQNGKRG